MNLMKRAMRDVFIETLTDRMIDDDRLFFLTADFGSPALDRLKELCGNRFINVGIAEQNLINVATGLALEGYILYAYAIAPFITMRCFEQIRINLSMLSQIKKININLIGVGAGCSYDVSGPSHHCLEDIIIMRMLPNIDVFSPSDYVLASKYIDYTIEKCNPKYLRFDAKPLPAIYKSEEIDIKKGFSYLREGKKICIISTGYMTHIALEVIDHFKKDGVDIGLIDFFSLKNFDVISILELLREFETIITIEEGFIRHGGMDSIIADLILDNHLNVKLFRLGMHDKYTFDLGNREHIHKINGLGALEIIELIKTNLAI